jgi:hypothetical protein
MQTVTLPKSLLVKVLRASREFEAVQEELEDLLISRNQQMLKILRRARRDHLKGKTRPWTPPR